uniref:ORF52 n=1 Tax=Malaco herpesvirus 4 TaxID=3031800 RepID=A0AA48P8Z4_9VIRU|nr:TPA_asm: ORF52 [Malaco herpesvirus 4]
MASVSFLNVLLSKAMILSVAVGVTESWILSCAVDGKRVQIICYNRYNWQTHNLAIPSFLTSHKYNISRNTGVLKRSLFTVVRQVVKVIRDMFLVFIHIFVICFTAYFCYKIYFHNVFANRIPVFYMHSPRAVLYGY